MSKFFFPDKKGNITGSNSNDVFVWLRTWKKSITVKAKNGNDYFNFKKSKYKNNLYGDNGNDTILGGSNIDLIKGGNGNDSILGYNGNDKLYGDAGKDTIYGGNGNDYIVGGASDDKLYGEAGNDTIYGNTGNDYILGGNSNDKLYGGDGKDTIYGGNGNDYIKGENSNDKLYGGNDQDTIYGGTGHDYISGDNGNDKLYGQDGNDSIYGGNGNDTIYAGAGNDYIKGDAGHDIIYCEKGNNTIYGGSGNDTIYVGSGLDRIDAGEGTNSIIFTSKTGNAIITNNKGIDKLLFSEGIINNYNFSNNNLILTYNNNKTVTIKDYLTKAKNIKILNGNKEYTIQEPVTPIELKENLQIGETLNFNVSSGTDKTIVVKNPFSNKLLSYNISSLSNTQSVTCEYLKNGRLIIQSNLVNIVAGTNQADDIILLGDNNKIDTGNDNDIVRVGYVIDAGNEYETPSYGNTINTGAGEDYITLFGYNNIVDTGSDIDRICYAGGSESYYSTISNCEFIRAEFENFENENCDYSVGWVSQGTGGGDCRLLSLLQSISQKNSLSDFVSITSNSNQYNVSFLHYINESQNSVTITQSELDSFENSYGDKDVVLIDCALNKLLSINRDYNRSTVDCAYYNSFSEYFYGTSETTYTKVTSNNIDVIGNLWNMYNNGTITNFTLGISEFSEDLSLGIVGGHAYSVKDYTDSYISLINVWDTADILNLDIDTLKSLTTYAIVYGYGNDTLLSQGSGVLGQTINFDEIKSDIASWTNDNSSMASEIYNSMYEEENIIAYTTSDFINSDI